MSEVEKRCSELVEECMKHKWSLDTIKQVLCIGASDMPEKRALHMISELMMIVKDSSERTFRERLSELIVEKNNT